MEPIARFDTKSRLAYEAIRKSITDGHYLPGEKIGISEVARQLKTSDIPVREAMQRLQAEGFLEYTPHVGFRVTKPDFDKYTDVYEVRQLLEADAAARAAVHRSADALAGLKQLREKMRVATAASDPNAFCELNHAFHAAIFSASDNPVLVRLIEQAGSIYPRTHAIFVMFPQRLVSAQAEHEELIGHLEHRDAAAARVSYLDHMAHGYALLLQYHRVSMEKELQAQPQRRSGRLASEGN
jgi:DNA-binding GntR family transcriptional regulator